MENFPPHITSYGASRDSKSEYLDRLLIVRFKAVTTASMKMRALWDITPCSLVGVHGRFRSAYFLHHQVDE
jgi:hypothetical protein